MSIDIQAFARLFVDSLMIGSEESIKDECFGVCTIPQSTSHFSDNSKAAF